MEEFEDQVPPTTCFSVGYFEGRQSTKKWLITQEDLSAMYSAIEHAGKTEVCLWCDGCFEESDSSSSHRKEREIAVQDLAHQSELRRRGILMILWWN